MTPAEVVQLLVLIFGPVGVLGGLWSIWSTRQKPGIDKQQAADASRKASADTFTVQLEGLVKIIDEYRTERDRDHQNYEASKKDFECQLQNLKIRVEAAEQRASAAEEQGKASQAAAEASRALIKTALDHIYVLEEHINNHMPPPPPPIPSTLSVSGEE